MSRGSFRTSAFAVVLSVATSTLVGCTSDQGAGADGGSASTGVSTGAGSSSGGGSETPTTSCSFDAGVSLVPGADVDAGACPTGQLVAAPTSTITTPDPFPAAPTLAGSPSGSFLAAWTDDAAVWASALQPGPAGTTASAAIKLTSSGTCPVAASTGAGYAVAWGDSSAVKLQSLDAQGTPIGSPATVLSASAATCPQAMLSTAGGLAVAMTVSQPVGGEDIVTESVTRVDASNTASPPIVLDTVGPGVSGDVALADLGGQTYVAFVEWPDASADAADTAVARVDWSTGTAVPQAKVPGFFQSFVAAGGQLWLSTYGANGYLLYTAIPGASFQQVGQGCSAFDVLAVDACGQLVGTGIGGFTPGGVAGGFYAQAFGGDGSQVSLGDVTESALAGAASTFGVLWFARIGPGVPYGDGGAPGSLSFTTLSWK